MRRGLALALASFAAAGTVAGCASDKATKVAVELTATRDGRLALSAPRRADAGVVDIEFENSTQDPHQAQLVKVDGSHTRDDVVDAVTGHDEDIPAWLLVEGGVGNTAGGQTRSAKVRLTPGRYFVVDTATDENDNSYAKRGAVAELTVSGGSDGAVPASGARIEARDYEFTVPALRAGNEMVTFENVGAQPHLLVAAPIAPGKSIADVEAAFTAPQDQAPDGPPLDFSKATTLAAVEGNRTVATTISLEKGNYAFICFLSDRGGGAPHYTLGMLQEASVT